MMLTRTVLCAAIVLTMLTPLMAAKVPTEKEKLRAEAEHVC